MNVTCSPYWSPSHDISGVSASEINDSIASYPYMGVLDVYYAYIPLVVAELWKSKYSSTFFSSDSVDLSNFNCDNSSPYTINQTH